MIESNEYPCGQCPKPRISDKNEELVTENENLKNELVKL
tara:strand:- start:357 stop:473 length:117 start_codon:yes stop_codon:yes gene_type:complete